MATQTSRDGGDENDSPLSNADQSLDTIFDAIYGAVTGAHREMQRGREQQLNWFFPPELSEDGTQLERKARVVSIPLPTPDGGTAMRDIPLFALVPHREITIDELTVRMKVSLGEVVPSGEEARAPSMTAQLASSRGENFADVEIKFKGCDPVEGVARINDALVKRIL